MENNLFNEKTITKNIVQIEPTSKQKKASGVWIKLLENKELQEEVANYPKFMIYILDRLLGYDITTFKHEEKNMEFPFKDKSGEQVKIIATDGLTPYPDIMKKTFGYYNLKKGLIEHRVVTQSKGEGFNIWIERLHNTLRQRIKIFRGFHGSVESANAIMKGLEIHYNFIRPHESLKGKTPSDMAISELEFKTPNRWLELIELSNK